MSVSAVPNHKKNRKHKLNNTHDLWTLEITEMQWIVGSKVFFHTYTFPGDKRDKEVKVI